MEKGAVKGRGGCGYGRIERAVISDSVGPAEQAELIGVQVKNLINGEKKRLTRKVHLANFRKVPS